ncbi:MAG TPA: alpha/beta hydrolase [Pseudonocardiaceae bacterium]|jgi:proline iminopeptidase
MTEETFVIDSGAGPISGSAGTDGGRDLLLLHGGPGLSDYMDLLAGETAGWRAIRYQQRGVAPSSVDGPFTVARHVADAVAVLDGLGVDRAVVLGHSWGAHLALQLASAAPDRVSAVIAVDGLGPDGDGHVPAFAAELRRRLPADAVGRCAELDAIPDLSDADALESTALLWPSYFAQPAQAPPLPAGLRLSVTCSVGTFASIFDELPDGTFARRLAQLTVPTFVVIGDASPMPRAAGEETAQLIPGSELIVVAGSGHLPWHEQPGCLAAVLDRVG